MGRQNTPIKPALGRNTFVSKVKNIFQFVSVKMYLPRTQFPNANCITLLIFDFTLSVLDSLKNRG